MKTLPIALQVYSIRKEAEADFRGSMQQVKNMGYDGVELAGLYGYAPEEIRSILEEVGLIPISAHVSYDEILEDMEGTIEKYRILGCEYIAIPYLAEDQRPESGNFDTVVEHIKKIGELCKEKGIVLLYHNHDFEFQKMADGRYGLDYLYESISAEYLKTELDTCWVAAAGESPVQYIKKYAGRCPLIHLKDYVGKKALDTFELRAVGCGIQDNLGILDASVESGANWIVVEMDDHYENTPMEDTKISMEFLNQLGWYSDYKKK